MAFSVSLSIDDKELEVLRCTWSAYQETDMYGQPASGVVCGEIRLFIAGSDDDTFEKWIADPTKAMDGTVTFSIDDKSFKKMEFKNAFILSLAESFRGEGNAQLNENDNMVDFKDGMKALAYARVQDYHNRSGDSFIFYCVLSAESIKLDGVDQDNNW